MDLVIIQAISWFRINHSAFGFPKANPSALVLLKPI
jgi:hypothetical protein